MTTSHVKQLTIRISASVLAVMVFGLLTTGEAVAGKDKAAVAAALKHKAIEQGEVNVIVGLSLTEAYKAESTLKTKNAIATQRRAIAQARKALHDDIVGLGGAEYKDWPTLPYVALKVGSPALERLAGSALVSSIQEDELSSTMLASATSLTGADLTAASGFVGDDWAVVILDTGIDVNHPFFSGRVVWQACYSNGAGGGQTLCPGGATSQFGPGAADVTQANGTPIANCNNGGANICDHGTHVAGIAAGADSVALARGYNGVAPGANIIAIQVFTRFNSDADCGGNPGDGPCVSSYASDQISALNYVNTTLVPLWDISSINMSLGGGQNTGTCDGDARKAPIDALKANGVATVIAAGNDGWTDRISTPGCISTAVTVGAVEDTNGPTGADTMSSFSNNSATVDILAPGQFIDSSVPNDAFGSKSGTSMATPHIAGAFATIRSIVGSSASVDDILTLMRNTGVLVTDGRVAMPAGATTGLVRPRLQLDTAVSELVPADVRVFKECKPDQPLLSNQLGVCTIYVDNLGDGPALGVALVDSHVSTATFTLGTVSTSAGTCTKTPNPQLGAGTVSCDLGNMAAGDRITITFAITGVTAQDINDIATVSSDSVDPNLANNEARDGVTIVATADLAISKSDSPDPVVAGTQLTYTITVDNDGPAAAQNVVVRDDVAAGVSIVSASTAGGSCLAGEPGNPAKPTLCVLGSIPVGGTKTVTIRVNVLPGTLGQLNNDATVSSDTADPNNANNHDSEATTVEALANLSVQKSDSPDPVYAGANLSYAVHVANAGPSTARGVSLVDTLPSQVDFISASFVTGTGSCVPNAGTPTVVNCSINDLAPAAFADVVILVKVKASVPDGTSIVQTAALSATTPDPDASDNSATISTQVLARAELWIDKTGFQVTGNPSRTIRYTLAVNNKAGCEADDALSCGAGGPSDAQGVVVVDSLPLDPKKVKVVFVSPSCSYSAATHKVTCRQAVLPAGASVNFRIDIQVAGSVGEFTNLAEVTSTTTDPNPANNSDVLKMVVKGGTARPSK